jgi:sec-independent protein translocase protein TatA
MAGLGIGVPELLVLLVLVLIVFGTRRTSGMARAIGRGMGEFQRVKERVGIDPFQNLSGSIHKAASSAIERATGPLLGEVERSVKGVIDVTGVPKGPSEAVKPPA